MSFKETHHTNTWRSLTKCTAGHTSLDIIIIKEIFKIYKMNKTTINDHTRSVTEDIT